MNNLYIKELESQVAECYNYFVNNTVKNNLIDLKALNNSENLEDMLLKLQKTMNTLITTNIVNLIDHVIEDGRLTTNNVPRQFNVNSIQTTSRNRIYLICHEIIGYDEIERKYILDNVKSFIEFVDIKRIF